MMLLNKYNKIYFGRFDAHLASKASECICDFRHVSLFFSRSVFYHFHSFKQGLLSIRYQTLFSNCKKKSRRGTCQPELNNINQEPMQRLSHSPQKLNKHNSNRMNFFIASIAILLLQKKEENHNQHLFKTQRRGRRAQCPKVGTQLYFLPFKP